MGQFSNHMDKIPTSKIRMIAEKATAMAAEGRSVVKMQSGEPDFATPQHIIDVAIESLKNKDTHYTPNRGTKEMCKAIADKMWRDNGIKADPDQNVLVVTGCAEALMCAVMGLLDPGDEMIVIEPAFINYAELAKMAGANVVYVQAKMENEWLPLPEDIRKALTDKTRMILLNTPSNPTGAVYPKELLEEIAKIAIDNDLIVAVDEVYEKLVFDRPHFSIGSLPGMEERTVTINGMSKGYAMTGWRVGYVVACKELMLPMLKFHQYSTVCSPTFVQKACVDALYNSDADIERMRLEYLHRRDLVCDLLSKCDKLSYTKPEGTFYLYINISKTGMGSEEFVMKLLEAKAVSTVFATIFDHVNGNDYIRISIANSEEELREAIKRIIEFVEEL